MNVFPKLALGGGVAILVLASIGVGIGIGELDELSKKTSEYTSDANTEITKDYTDEDGMGSAGWLIMIEGEYLDDVTMGLWVGEDVR